MNSVEYYENPRKLKLSAAKNTIFGFIGLALGIFVPIALAPPPFSTQAYMAAGFRGATIAVGIMLLFMGLSLAVKSAGSPPHLVSADTNGIILTVINEKLFIPWHNVREIRSIKKDNQRCVVLDIRDPDAFIKVSSKHGKLLRKNLKTYGSPAVVSTNFCASTNGQIADKLGEFLKIAVG